MAEHGLAVELTQELVERNEVIQQALGRAGKSLLEVGRLLKEVKSDLLSEGTHFKKWVEEVVGLDPSYAYKLIKAWDTYGYCEEATAVSAAVLHVLMYTEDPKARLQEALAEAKEKGTKVSIKDAKEVVRKAKEVIEEGEKEVYEPKAGVTIEDLEALTEPESESPVSQTVSSSRNTRRAKRTLNTLFDLLVLELSNAEITTDDLRDAVLEMLLSSDPAETEVITQLRQFCDVVANTGK